MGLFPNSMSLFISNGSFSEFTMTRGLQGGKDEEMPCLVDHFP